MRFELTLPLSYTGVVFMSLSGRRGSNPRPLAWKANALPTELLPLVWEKMDSNHRRYKPADLQSAPFGHSGILPIIDDLIINDGIFNEL